VKFLGESNPSRRESTDSSKRPRLKYPYPKSIRFNFTDMSRVIASKYLGPEYKGGPEPLIPDISEKSQFEKFLNLVIRRGEPGNYSHSAMPGREYTKEDVDYLITLLIAVEKRILHFNGEVAGEMQVPLIERLKNNRQFKEAVEDGDLSKELSIGLHELDIGKRAAQLSQRNPELGLEVVRSCAIEDVSLCSAIARQHVKAEIEDPPEEVEIGVRLVDLTIRGKTIPSTSIFTFAMSMLTEIRWITSKAKETESIDQAFADFNKDLSEHVNLKWKYLLFVNYQNISPENWDHRLDLTLSTSVIKYVSFQFGGILIYDRDQDEGVQLNQFLNIGVSYNFQNYKDDE
jgi:hypothetical protein